MFLSRWWRSLRHADDLLQRVELLEQDWGEVQQEWIDKRDALDRLLRRLTLRETRTAAREAAPQDAVGAPIVRPEGDGSGSEKAALWERARAKGMLR